ncbi:hypothetical protein AGMMS50262_07430 [Bacteroidia bacterium]|nr:hypothetical protein AGMMS50262_07430 [Bacteroidia bacterium]
MNEQSHSQFGIEILSSLSALSKDLSQKLFVTDLYVYGEIAGKQTFYLPERNAQYWINSEEKMLTQINISAQTVQLSQIKQLIGELSTEEILTEKGKIVRLKNKNQTIISFNAEIEIVEFAGIEQTVFNKYEEFQSALRPIYVPLKANEIISSMTNQLIINGQKQESAMKLIEIKTLQNPNLYDHYLNFTISGKI